MKTPIQMSQMIRRKKKSMQDDPDIVDLSGIPMDKTDEDIMDQEELTTELGLDHNKPTPRDTDPYSHQALMADSAARANEAHEYDRDDTDTMPLKHYADGSGVGMGRGAIAGGDVPKHTRLEKINGFNEGGEVDEAKAKRRARMMKMMGRG